MVCQCCVFLFCIMLTSAAAFAQAPAQIHALVKVAQVVSITDEQGQTLHGRITEVNADRLVIGSGQNIRQVPYSEIVRIDREDGLINGTLIGLGVGVALGSWAATNVNDDYREDNLVCGVAYFEDCTEDNPAVAAGILMGLSTALGAGIDALISHYDRNVYYRDGGPRVSLSPILGRRVGAVIGISW